MECHVFINRVHKSRPYNCVFYIPVLKVGKLEYAIESNEVQEAIDKIYGKKLVVQIHDSKSLGYLEYNVEKQKAIL